jgi:hypothetical protein
MSRIKIGSQIMWRGAWGKEIAKKTKVIGIEVCPLNTKYGRSVKSVSWDTIRGENRSVIVTLENGHWAWDYQLDEIKK